MNASLVANSIPATSNAPKVGRKRRLSDEDNEEAQSSTKKLKGDSPIPTSSSEEQAPDSVEVKEVTEGVQEVALEDKDKKVPENIPLPDEDAAGELDESSASIASTPPPEVSSDSEKETSAAETLPTRAPAEEAKDKPEPAEKLESNSDPVSKDSVEQEEEEEEEKES